MACVCTALLPGCTTCPGGGWILQPCSLGSGTALCGITTSTQSGKWHCIKYWSIYTLSSFLILYKSASPDCLQWIDLFFIIGGTKGGKSEWTKGKIVLLLLINQKVIYWDCEIAYHTAVIWMIPMITGAEKVISVPWLQITLFVSRYWSTTSRTSLGNRGP